jgi:type IV fimbrial biogenesis protein FimT
MSTHTLKPRDVGTTNRLGRGTLRAHCLAQLARRSAPAFTLVELLIVITIMAIIAGLAAPMFGEVRGIRLQEAAKLVAADIEFAQTDAILHSADPRLIRFNTAASQYWIAAGSAPATPIANPLDGSQYLVTLGAGRAAGASGVAIQSYSLGGDTDLRFDGLGVPDQTTDASVTLAAGTNTLTLIIKAGTGEVLIP